jgi:hypothetical protein
VTDGVCVVWAGFLEKPLEVVHRRPDPMLLAVCGAQDAPHARAACFVVSAANCGRGPWKALLVPLFSAFGAILDDVGGDIGWCLPVASQGHLPTSLGRAKHDRLIIGGALGGDAVQLPEHVPEEVAKYGLSRALCVVLRPHARTALASLAASLGLTAPTLLP